MTESPDITIVGAGLVGASLASALASANLRVAVIEPRMSLPATDGWDSRVYTISPGCAAFLEAIGAWQVLPEERITRVETMKIFGDDAVAQLDFSAYDAGLRELAFIVENSRLQHALWGRLQQSPHVSLLCPAQCESMSWHDDHVALTLTDGREWRTKLVVGADGADSWVRTQAGIAVNTHDYQQLGVVANFLTEKPHRGTAFQWFRRDGVLALLPLPENRVSMVWSAAQAHADELLALTAEELAARVAVASGNTLGELKVITPAAVFPLRLQRVARLIGLRVALIGDAAHNVHPLAGQGVNLGLRDARELAAVLNDRGPQHDCGDHALLRRYERSRREDIALMQYTTDALEKLFASSNVWAAGARNMGLRWVQHLAPVKNLLVRHAAA